MMMDTRRQLATVLGAMLVITASLTGAFGTPQASDTAEAGIGSMTCDAAQTLSFGVVSWLGKSISGCGDGGVDQTTQEKILNLSAIKQKLSLHAIGAGAQESSDQARTRYHNFLTQSRNIASIRAKAAAARLFANNVTDPTALRNEMHQAINDYYAVRERNLLAAWNAQMAKLAYIQATAENDSNIDQRFMSPSFSVQESGYAGTDWRFNPNATQNFTLLNGSVASMATPFTAYIHADGDTADPPTTKTIVVDWSASGASVSDGTGVSASVSFPVRVSGVSGPNESLSVSSAVTIRPSDWDDLDQQFRDAAADMRANYDLNFTQAMVDKYEAGDLNVKDLVSAEMLASEWGTGYNETGSSVYKWASAAALGLDSPDLSNVSHMTLSYRKPTPVQYVTFNASGGVPNNVPVNVTVSWEGHSVTRTVVTQYSEMQSARVAVPLETDDDPTTQTSPTVTLSTPSSSTTWSSEEVDSGETTSISNVTITAEAVGRWRQATEPGFLFAQTAPDGGWQVGQTYNASTLNGSAFFAPAGQRTRLARLQGEFTLTGAESDSGENLSVVHTRSYNTQTANASDLKEQLHQYEELYKETQQVLETVKGGSGGGDQSGRSPYVLVALFALALALIGYQQKD